MGFTMDSTDHHIFFSNANAMKELVNESVELVVTSPPYPMIKMWDGIFSDADPAIATALAKGDDTNAFHFMHNVLNQVWKEVQRIIKPGGIVCINIGDATRKLSTAFKLHPNHAQIINAFSDFDMLPLIIWRKQTNKPTKFMGSGMLPAGAYVTLEHEYILIFRKPGKRKFSTADKQRRHQSAFFWEERNLWFSDVWTDLKGVSQLLNDGQRDRSAAFPFELPYRLINMFSLQGDTVCDPFMGTGTTALAAMICGRNSVGYELDVSLAETIHNRMSNIQQLSQSVEKNRLSAHRQYMEQRKVNNKPPKHTSINYEMPVVSKQEATIYIPVIADVHRGIDFKYKVIYNNTASAAEDAD